MSTDLFVPFCMNCRHITSWMLVPKHSKDQEPEVCCTECGTKSLLSEIEWRRQ